MPRGWQWDPTLFEGAAPFYTRGRLPYPPALPPAIRSLLQLNRRGRLLDAGCGPGTLALPLAPWFAEVVGLDPDPAMLDEARRRAAALGAGNIRWVCRRAEELSATFGRFQVVVFAQSFHWMEREQVAAVVFAMLEPGGAVLLVSPIPAPDPQPGTAPHPPPPRAALAALRARYLGPVRRAGQGLLHHGTPDGEDAVFRAAGFGPARVQRVEGGALLTRSIDDLVAAEFSNSAAAPHLFGARLPAYEAELRALLAASTPSGRFTERMGDVELRVWRRPVSRR